MPWNVWTSDKVETDRMSFRRGDDVYRDRRGDGSSRDVSTRYDSYRPNDESIRRDDATAAHRNGTNDRVRRRASVHEPVDLPLQRPQPLRSSSQHVLDVRRRNESPARSPRDVLSSSSTPRTEYGQAAGQFNPDVPAPGANDKPTDPRVRLLQNRKESTSIRTSPQPTGQPPYSPTVTTDSHAATDTAAATPPKDVVMSDITPPVPDMKDQIVSVLLPSLQSAVDLGIQKSRFEITRRDFEEAKKRMDRLKEAVDYDKEAPHFKALTRKYDITGKAYHRDLQRHDELHQAFTSTTSEMAQSLAAKMSDEVQRYTEHSFKAVMDQISAQNKSMQEAIDQLRSSDTHSNRITTLEKKQDDLKEKMDKTQPTFEENIHFLLTRDKERDVEVKKQRAQIADVKADNGNIRRSIEELRAQHEDLPKLSNLKADFNALEAKASSDQKKQDKEILGIAVRTTSVETSLNQMRYAREKTIQSQVGRAEFEALKTDLGNHRSSVVDSEEYRLQIGRLQSQSTLVKQQVDAVSQKIEELAKTVGPDSLDSHSSKMASKDEVSALSVKVDAILERPGVLAAKERMLLINLETLPKRVNDIENGLFELLNNLPAPAALAQPPVSSNKRQEEKDQGRSVATNTGPVQEEKLQKLEEELRTTQVDVKNHQHGIDQLLIKVEQVQKEARQSLASWDKSLQQCEARCLEKHTTVKQSVEVVEANMRDNDQELRSLAARYNNLNTASMARRITETSQPVVAHLKTEQTKIKEQMGRIEPGLAEVQARIGDLKKNLDAAGDSRVEEMKIRIQELEQHVQTERDALLKLWQKQSKRLTLLDARKPRRTEWPASEDEEVENSMRGFSPHSQSTASSRSTSTTSSLSSSSTSRLSGGPPSQADQASTPAEGLKRTREGEGTEDEVDAGVVGTTVKRSGSKDQSKPKRKIARTK